MKQHALFLVLAAALFVRLPGIGWGLPPTTPQVRTSDLRCSYAFDEDDILTGVAKASVARLDFDPNEYHWGTLHIELVLLALDGAQAVGLFGVPWRSAYYDLVDGDFVRVYVIGRLVAVAAALLTVGLLFQFPEKWAGMFAAMLVAVSPSHMLQSNQVRVDVTMTALLVLTLLAAMRTQVDRRPHRFLFLGIAAGLAIAGKYSAVTAVAGIALAALVLQRFPWRGVLAVVGGAFLGFIAGGPYVVIKPLAFYDAMSRYVIRHAQVPPEFVIAPGKLLEMHVANLARFSMGPPAFLLGGVGLLRMLRRRSPTDWMILAGIVGYVAILLPLRWPLVRYDLPLTVLLGLCAGNALERLPKRWQYSLALAALGMPFAACIGQIHYMRAPHPANVILERILNIVPPGTVIARPFCEAPPLNQKVYPLGPDVFLGDTNAPAWLLTTNLPDESYQASTLALLHAGYEEVGRAQSKPILAWATLSERSAPHDWKYTHPSFTLYRKKSP